MKVTMKGFKVEGQYVFIAGGSRGLGKALGVQLAQRGANIVLIARGKSGLEKAQEEVQNARVSESQNIDILTIDLCNPEEVKAALLKYQIVPDVLICVAGGSTPAQIGFLADLSTEGITSCFESNYLSSVFITQACLRLWIKDPQSQRTRHLVFISSGAAFVGVPGYAAYSPAKAAIRSLADTLRQELLLYGNRHMYKVHCAFPGPFITESFLAEQASKPQLTKMIEGSDIADDEIQEKVQSAATIAKKVLKGLDNGYFFISSDWEGAVIMNNMRGSSPRDNILVDSFWALVAFLAWPILRWHFDRMTTQYGKQNYLSKPS